MKRALSRLVYHIVRGLVRLFYPKVTVEGAENLPEGAAIVVGNHAQMNGPIACNIYFPGKSYIWCAAEMMRAREVPAYAFQDFWSGKPAWNRWFYRLLSYVIAPLSACVFSNADCIGVYHDMRVVSTMKNTVQRLQEGARVIIFPEHNVPYNNIVYEFQEHFVDVARLYHRRTGETVSFVPLYTAAALHKLVIGKPVAFDPDAPIEEERKRVCAYLASEITFLACALPRHTVVPYPNIPKRQYPENTPSEVTNS